MWIPQNPVHRLKIAVHLFQAVLTFVTGCLTLAIMTDKGSRDSRVQWCFALCFLTMPALMYQCIVPCWTRLWRLANPYVFICIDVVYTIFWISAFSAVTAWTAKGMHQGALDKKLDANQASCSTFAFGSTSTCQIAKATTGFGVILSILFLSAAIISALDAHHFQKSGSRRANPDLYGQTPSRASSPEAKDDWDASTEDLDSKQHHRRDSSDVYEGWAAEYRPSAGFFVESDTTEGRHPGRQVSCSSAKTIPYERDLTPSAMSPTTPEDKYAGIFPPATANYSFSRE